MGVFSQINECQQKTKKQKQKQKQKNNKNKRGAWLNLHINNL